MAYELNYRPPDILIPIAKRVPLVLNQWAVPLALDGQVSGAVRDVAGAKEIGHAFGRSRLIEKPLLVETSLGRAVVMTEGVTEAAELEDLALMALERQEERAKTDWHAEQRERMGLPPREQFPDMFADALERRIKQHKANPVTDPPRQPRRHNPTNKVMFAMPGGTE